MLTFNAASAQASTIAGQSSSLTGVRRQCYCREHAEIVSNITNRNTHGAAEAMRVHLASVLGDMFPN
ncbi:FCD domain-containing protein [Hoeflea sp. YIM 152468]|uniref:FCD domain-containing protein n=1 Tax=Hoeflea sp. YIM 152468 TaxID=3031759 RepID=UPI0023DB647B|nr:FCD domain-containing protein [Hoeflea sp. YIM 152468]MDF1609832.1 FCD domain-containing protein [Hoeflea sp. YIM 152468]